MRRLAAAASTVAALFCVSAIPAQAAQAEHVPSFTHGKVLSQHGGLIRSGPGKNYRALGHMRNNQIVPLLCETTGQAVRGHRLWYKLNVRPEMWASSVLIAHIDKAPVWCASHGLVAHPQRQPIKVKHIQRNMKNQPLAPHNPQNPQTPQFPQSMPNTQIAENQKLKQQELQKLQQELLNEQAQLKSQHLSGLPTQVKGKS
jgi:hypothetical protein